LRRRAIDTAPFSSLVTGRASRSWSALRTDGLSEFCVIVPPGKREGIDGAEVEPYFLDGKIKEIADYCETDVVNTYRVWLRYELFAGR
jgi:predicted PolB exonuclease-like 3'-5' exonuclease